MERIIVIPDVHGRDFWRYALKGHEEERIIFLGDYLDPYSDDCVFWSDAFQGLKDIIALKKKHPENITLLLGNHDLHYLFEELEGSRKNIFEAPKIRKTLMEDLDLFKMADECTHDGKRILFSHAGVNLQWLRMHPDLFPEPEKVNADTFNSMMFEPGFIKALSDISYRRGGWELYGSMVWADLMEFVSEDSSLPETVQVFGHTRHSGGDISLREDIHCLDCGSAFTIGGNCPTLEI
ncbi:MAG: metallophosphoesterase [Bacteroidales bacterium]|nr:metallophosphoesterase [Bacteroidales bacterium]